MMGVYTVNCPECNKPTLWFSGSIDQRCSDCKAKDDDKDATTLAAADKGDKGNG